METLEMHNIGPSQNSVQPTTTGSPTSASDFVGHPLLSQQPHPNTQEALWATRASNYTLWSSWVLTLPGEQWRRVTGKGTVLSRYISASSEGLNFAICDNKRISIPKLISFSFRGLEDILFRWYRSKAGQPPQDRNTERQTQQRCTIASLLSETDIFEASQKLLSNCVRTRVYLRLTSL